MRRRPLSRCLRWMLAVACLALACNKPAPVPERASFPAHLGPEHVAVSPDGQFISFASRLTKGDGDPWKPQPGQVTIWEASSGKELAVLPQARWVQSLSFSPDGKLLAVGCGMYVSKLGGEVKLYSAPEFKERATLKFEEGVFAVVFSPDGKLMATASGGPSENSEKKPSEIKIWSVDGLKETRACKGQLAWITALLFSADSKTLLVGDIGGGAGSVPARIRFLDVGTGREGRSFPVQQGDVRRIAYVQGGRTLAVMGGNVLKMWDLETEEEHPAGIAGGYLSNASLAVSSDGNKVAMSMTFHGSRKYVMVQIWDLDKDKELARWEMDKKSFPGLAFLPDGKGLVGGGWEVLDTGGGGVIKIWNVPE